MARLTNEQRADIIELKAGGMSSRNIAEIVLGRRTRKSTVNQVYNTYLDAKGLQRAKITPMAKILTFDVEVAPSIVAAFNMFKHFSSPDHVLEFPYMLTFACKWLHEEEIRGFQLPDYPLFTENHKDDFYLIQELWYFLDEADIIVAHNAKFDEGWFNQQCMLHGLVPPSPYKVICTYQALKKATSLPAKSLKYSTKYFKLSDQKLDNDGIPLWIRCMRGDIEAFDDMLTYNIGDIPTCESLYLTLRPFMKNHPNVAIYGDQKVRRCVACGSEDLEELENGASTNISTFKAYRCNSCGKTQRGGMSTNTTAQRKLLNRNII